MIIQSINNSVNINTNQVSHGIRYAQGMEMMDHAYRRAIIRDFIAKIFGRTNHLEDLNNLLRHSRINAVHEEGVKTVDLRFIEGSEGRMNDFDKDFNPLHKRTAQRWVGIALARLSGAQLPPVQLIRIGEKYFVRDGHHRISVAKALGELYIEARVLVYDLELSPISFTPEFCDSRLLSKCYA